MPTVAYAAGGSRDRVVVDNRSTSGWPTAPGAASACAYAIELNSGSLIVSQNADTQMYPASITKVMTALLAVENLKLDDEITFSESAVNVDITGKDGRFAAGDVMTVEEVLYAFLLESINECGNALAEKISGSVEEFSKLMNKRAAELGCTNTHFNNPHGLNDETHLTTAHDMAMIYWACVQNADYLKINSTATYTVPTSSRSKSGYTFINHHKMMIEGSGYYDEDVVAGKTGYTSDAGNTLVTYLKRDGMEVIVVLLKSQGAQANYDSTREIANFVFNNFKLTDNRADLYGKMLGLNLTPGFMATVDSTSTQLVPKSGTAPASSASIVMAAGQPDLSLITALDEGSGSSTTLTNSSNDSNWFLSTLKVILIVIIIAIIIVFLYWFVIQLIKRRRAKKRREILARKNRAKRLRTRTREIRKDIENLDDF